MNHLIAGKQYMYNGIQVLYVGEEVFPTFLDIAKNTKFMVQEPEELWNFVPAKTTIPIAPYRAVDGYPQS